MLLKRCGFVYFWDIMYDALSYDDKKQIDKFWRTLRMCPNTFEQIHQDRYITVNIFFGLILIVALTCVYFNRSYCCYIYQHQI